MPLRRSEIAHQTDGKGLPELNVEAPMEPKPGGEPSKDPRPVSWQVDDLRNQVAALRSELQAARELTKSNMEMAVSEHNRLTAELQAAQAETQQLELVLREHNEAAAIFQPGGRLHKIAGLALGKNAVVEGFKWFEAQLAAAQEQVKQMQELFDPNHLLFNKETK